VTLLPLICAIAATAAAQLLFKFYFRERRRVWLVLTIALFGTATVMSYLALKEWSLSTVYMATGVTYVLVLAGAAWLLGERIVRRQVLATALIVAGVVLFNV
jgi:multidrug transporter EmrE-like cation transporter